ncbi:hypothetical protein BpHYR1_031552 [Brachionus plicatilis]|uniref:Uncharacterized protein n=1 Tax=Brachionus plicatilis TaxID=10195 RepID=A0A3M7QA53_BRAPC|nr:hypothetical protein BpHYR1_031552 [Brachionus plicatilis]
MHSPTICQFYPSLSQLPIKQKITQIQSWIKFADDRTAIQKLQYKKWHLEVDDQFNLSFQFKEFIFRYLINLYINLNNFNIGFNI